MKKNILLIPFFFMSFVLFAQTSDDAFKKPLKEVIAEIENHFDVKIRYPEELVQDKWVTYADWRFRPDVEKTMTNILASQDISFAKEGDKKYKLQHFQYHLKTPEEGKQQLEYLSTLYNNRAGWEKRKAELKDCMLSALKLSPLPPQPPSKPIITGFRKMNGYTIENVAIETLPGLYVCGSLYRPIHPKGKIPVVLNPNGHFDKGRYRADCQYRSAMLAKMGAMAFNYDLFAWGESLLQFKPEDHRRALAQTIQVLNSMRILDFLLSFKDADTNRVAITGASGGGSLTMVMTALDDRIKLSVPVVMLSSYHSGGCPCESGMGIHLCVNGTNNVEIASMAAPRPQLVISDGKDWTQHVPETAFPYLQRIYGYYDKTGLVENAHFPLEGHDYGLSKRKEMYDFIAGHFALNIKANKDRNGNIDESGVTIEKESAMYVFGENGEGLPDGAIKGFDALQKVFEMSAALSRQKEEKEQRYKVAVVDLMILKRQKLGAFQLTKEIGADGVEVDMGGLGSRETFDNKLAVDSIRRQFLDKASDLDLEICSLAMTGFFAQSFAERPTAVKAVQDCINTMKQMNVKVAFLPLGVKGDLIKYPELRPAIVKRLKEAGRMAEEAGVVIGIESALDAKGELQLLKDVGSPAVKSYFNFSNALKNGRDVNKELKILGRENIVQIHCTDDDGVWLQNDTRLDMKQVKKTLDEMKWSGWLVIERSRDARDPRNVRKNFGANTAYVKSVFQSAL